MGCPHIHTTTTTTTTKPQKLLKNKQQGTLKWNIAPSFLLRVLFHFSSSSFFPSLKKAFFFRTPYALIMNCPAIQMRVHAVLCQFHVIHEAQAQAQAQTTLDVHYWSWLCKVCKFLDNNRLFFWSGRRLWLRLQCIDKEISGTVKKLQHTLLSVVEIIFFSGHKFFIWLTPSSKSTIQSSVNPKILVVFFELF